MPKKLVLVAALVMSYNLLAFDQSISERASKLRVDNTQDKAALKKRCVELIDIFEGGLDILEKNNLPWERLPEPFQTQFNDLLNEIKDLPNFKQLFNQAIEDEFKARPRLNAGQPQRIWFRPEQPKSLKSIQAHDRAHRAS